ncbi:hypothetical protein QE152_g40943 [Popillia japonica]|uniref:Endonuclease/exonuclease/phosphatase domain-containing protein n=1 Tax=Popillia japonica TaxID=7064 RepID=A0AAW1HF46_POPJA
MADGVNIPVSISSELSLFLTKKGNLNNLNQDNEVFQDTLDKPPTEPCDRDMDIVLKHQLELSENNVKNMSQNISLLEKRIADLECIITLLKENKCLSMQSFENISLLEKRIADLECIITLLKENKCLSMQSFADRNGDKKKYFSTPIQATTVDTKNSKQSTVTTINLETSKENINLTSAENIKSSNKVLRHCVQTDPSSHLNQHSALSNDTRKDVVVGIAAQDLDPTINFAAVAKRAWLYVGRAAPSTQPADVNGWLKKKFPERQFIIEALSNRNSNKNNEKYSVSFKVGVDLDILDELNRGGKGEPKVEYVSLFHNNVRSLRNKTDELYILLNDLKFPNFICISEHWLNSDAEIMQSVWPDYRPVSWFCRTNLKGGGVAIYAKNDVKVYDINPDVDSVEQDFEYCSTKIKLNDKFFIILCLYRAPNGVFTNFRDKLIDLLEIVCSQCSCVFVAGDFNVNFNGNTGEACELLNIFSSFGCQRLFDQDTRIANQSHSCIDNIFCNDLSYVQSMYNPPI